MAKLNANEWYFFSFRDRKYATGFRTNRATITGYWKATGKDRTVQDPVTREIVGMRKTLVFYRNRAPNGIKTGWIMHEFRLETPHMPPKEDWVLCRVFHKSKGLTPDSEDCTKFSPQHMFETSSTTACAPPLAPSPPSNQTMSCGYYNQIMTPFDSSTPSHQNQSQSNSLLNLLQFSQETTNNVNKEITSKGDHDEYGFLWDMNLEENSLANGAAVSSNSLEDMRFEIDHNSMVFL